MRIIYYIFALSLIATDVYAVCGGSGLSRTAASASRTDVSDCVTAAETGATISVPTGTATWASTITLPTDKALTIQGAGIGSTVITCSAASCFELPLTETYSIGGFEFTGTASNFIVSLRGYGAVSGKTQRIHHNKMNHTGADYVSIDIIGEPTTNCNETTPIHPSILIDNNEFYNVRILSEGTACSFGDGNAQHRLWAQNSPVGSWPQIVYVEDNTFHSTGGLINVMDANYGGRYVFRFNTISADTGDNRGYIEVHGVQGGNRAVPWKEIYGNTATNTGNDNFFGLAFIRSGSGVIFKNRVPATSQTMRLNNQRSCESVDTSGQCNGTSNWDQNTGGASGYACRDQIGRMKDNTLWAIGDAYAQDLMPMYFWNNYKGAGTTQDVPELHPDDCTTLASHVQQNRDWYTENVSFDGTSGVGVGTAASKPATCTTGVSYWATDEGEWNSDSAGNDGRLYKCTATNTWSLYYTPYTYPHPLASGVTPTTWDITATAGANGALSCTTPVTDGQTTTCTATPNSGYYTSNITGCGGSWSSGNSYTTGAITADCEVTSTYAITNVAGRISNLGILGRIGGLSSTVQSIGGLQ